MIISAHFASLDTSHWAGLCASLIEKASRPSATRRIRALAADGWTVAISFHQIQELLAHENERIAVARLSALRHIESLVVVAGSTDDDVPGTVVDVQRLEIHAAIVDAQSDASAVRSQVREAFVRMTTGDAVVDAVMPVVHVLREQILLRQERERETASISQATVLDQSRIPFDLNGAMRSGTAIQAHFAALKTALSDELTERGDRRLSDPAKTASVFVESLTEHQEAITSSPQPIAELLKVAGLSMEDVAGFKHVGQVAELAQFRRCIETSSQGTGISVSDLRNLSQERLPTWVVHRALLRHRQSRPRIEGGDLTDGHLLSLAPYFDAVFVDKRTSEDVRRIRQHDIAAGRWLENVRKASSWSKAFDQLARWCSAATNTTAAD